MKSRHTNLDLDLDYIDSRSRETPFSQLLHNYFIFILHLDLKS